MKTLAIVPAGGAGRRMGAAVPKQFLPLAGIPVLVRTLAALQYSSFIDEILVAVPAADIAQVRGDIVAAYGLTKVTTVLAGGAERQDSVGNALRQVPDEIGIVLVHDAVRPFVTPEVIARVVAAAQEHGAAAAGVPVRDTVKRAGEADRVVTTVAREGLWLAQTPQAFHRQVILAAYAQAGREGFVGTDDAALVERMGGAVRMVPGDHDNIKITTPEDLARGEAILGRCASGQQLRGTGGRERGMRIGFGYDSHRLTAGRRLVLGGRVVPHDRGLAGHSDADVLIHAVCDAILGAAGAGDIGRHFPDTDPAYNGIASILLLERVAAIVAAKGCRVLNVDSTVVLERPKLAAYLGEMAANIAGALGIPPSEVSVKAKTNEGMGLVGAGEGAAAFAVVTLAGGDGK
ncbi:MAG: 2-C-methyl-D-erythritol 4-phosphate cytidylyltransferase [Syntrophales bacterium]